VDWGGRVRWARPPAAGCARAGPGTGVGRRPHWPSGRGFETSCWRATAALARPVASGPGWRSTTSRSGLRAARTSTSTGWWPCVARVHAQTDAPYATGRLVVTPLGAGHFSWTVVQRRSKWDGAEPTPRPDPSSLPEPDGLSTWATQAEPTQGTPSRTLTGRPHRSRQGPSARIVDRRPLTDTFPRTPRTTPRTLRSRCTSSPSGGRPAPRGARYDTAARGVAR